MATWVEEMKQRKENERKEAWDENEYKIKVCEQEIKLHKMENERDWLTLYNISYHLCFFWFLGVLLATMILFSFLLCYLNHNRAD